MHYLRKKEYVDFYMWMVENDYNHNIRSRVEQKLNIFLKQKQENVIVFGVEMTKYEGMVFDKYRNESTIIPFNTITKEQRKDITQKWVFEHRKKS